ncbi:MAG TPA: cyanophycinase, partial [Burkholderiaceae bacterium]|nr:cyanophycinase [Burkholderiaceae bacterium]
DTVRSRSFTGKPCRMLKNDWTEAWETPGNPEPLGMPLQYMVSGVAVAATHRYPDQTVDVAFNPVGQVVGQFHKVEKTAAVVQRWVEEYLEATERLNALNAAGVHVAGTSAGAAFISEHIIAYGDEDASPIAGSVSLAPGLGLTNRFVIDQHFRQRDRRQPLLTALAYNPFAVGIGLDEDTAAFIAPDNTLEVEGSGAVTVVDAAGLDFSSIDTADPGRAVCMLGLKLHILIQGATFNLHSRQAAANALARIKT